jgi:hypothetical protein
MSVPAAAMGNMAVSSAMSLSPIDLFLQSFNNNPYFIGIMMLLLNLGGRFISLEVTKQQEQFLQRPWVRRLLIFTVLFVATRNLWVAFWATVIAILLLGYLFNENSALCLFGSGGNQGSTCSKEGGDKKDEMTPEEKEILQRLSAKAQRYQSIQVGPNGADGTDEKDKDIEVDKIYMANLKLMK